MICVCIDGTNQIKAQPHPTNIALTFDALGGRPVDAGNGSFETGGPGQPVLGKYLAGVGTQGNAVLKILGNAFGDGIAEPIIRGYTYLSRNYTTGANIFITGFSRGATAARALAGFVAVHGLLDPTRYDPTDKDNAYLRGIAAWYAYRKPNGSFVDQTRLDLIAVAAGRRVPALTAADYIAPPKITAVGVYDTVSSLGLPHLDSSGDAVFDFSICDTILNDNVLHGFHALAADETRDLFSPTFWAGRSNVSQQIFPGAHSNVGGGYPERGLSDAALEWMLANLRSAGLALDRTLVRPPLAPNPLDLARDDAVTFPFKDTPRRARAFPTGAAAPSEALRTRTGEPTEVFPCVKPVPYSATGRYADGTRLA